MAELVDAQDLGSCVFDVWVQVPSRARTAKLSNESCIMHALIQPISLVALILVGFLAKRFGMFKEHDYRILQKCEFNFILPGAIIYSFIMNPHDSSLLLISLFSFIAALVPVLTIFATTRRTPVAQRSFLMLNGAGFNVGCFCFPVVQSLIGPAALVPAAMFDVGNCVMVAAGTNVITQSLLHIKPGKTLAQQGAGSAPTLPYVKPTDKDARRIERRSLLHSVTRGFLTSVSFDVYVVMIVLMLLHISLPTWIGELFAPLNAANAGISMLMVGMLTDLPESSKDVWQVARVVSWRLPFGILFACVAWWLLPFNPMIRETVALCCLAPIAIFSTLFTDKVLGNARLAGFCLATTAIISMIVMSAASFLMH